MALRSGIANSRFLPVQSADSRQNKRTMHRTFIIAAVAISTSLGPILAQTPVFIGTGYIATPPAPIRVAPGQIVTIFVSAKTILPYPVVHATTLPLPISLGGFSVTVRQGSNAYSAPMLSVNQFGNCVGATSSSPGCVVTELTVQIPFEMTPWPSPAQVTPLLIADLSINDNGTESVHVPIQPVAFDSIHVLTYCDVLGITGVQLSPSTIPACTSNIVAHADGSLVSLDAPAKPGEEIVIYAFGLGLTNPTPKTGSASPSPAATLNSPLYLQFDFRPNATPSQPWLSAPLTALHAIPTPLFVGLTPGQVGLYQINVRLPDSFPDVPPCQRNTAGNMGRFVNVVQSNLTINIGGEASFDGAPICVQSPQ